MMKKALLFIIAMAFAVGMHAQRVMETLDRGTVAVKVSNGVFVSWRILGEEYYDTKYNLYRDGTKVNSTPLDVSNFTDKGGSLNSTYTVSAVVRGAEQAQSKAVTVWADQKLLIPLQKVYSRRGADVTADYEPNDCSLADLDGDGQYEIILKRINRADGDNLYATDNDSAYVHFEAYRMDGTKLWEIDGGPNLVSGGQVETNLVAYDWDGDGKAELLMRAADGTILGDGTVCGDINKNYRDNISHTGNMTYMNAGDEFLVYMDGMTAKPYSGFPITYPLKRLEDGETDVEKAWGDGYGHRCNKFFFAAPYLDGRNPSIFLARGIYTRHKMIAYDVNPQTHQLTTRWTWTNNQGGSPWYGQGYHNFGISDVDLDGRDEIVYGSMVIDDNGKGLSTDGLGHGDAQHAGDLDPYRWGEEIYTCNETNPGSTYRDGTTGKIYYRYTTGSDVGRCMAANTTDDYLGSELVDATSGLTVSSVTDGAVKSSHTGITMNNNIYWDGDLCSETWDYQSRNSYYYGINVAIYKGNVSSAYKVLDGCYTNNSTKGNPCFQGDVLGDWREELLMRTPDNMSLVLYTTTDPTPWRNYTLLHDMQYRQAMVWQTCGYNQPPHVSYFLGKAEGITVAPPPLMTNGRTVETTSISSADNDRHVLLCDPDGGTVAIASGAQPYILTVNAFSHVQGTAASECTTQNTPINYSYSTYTLNGQLSGATRLVKQGEGILSLSGNQTHTGETDVWGGTLSLSGDMSGSAVYLKRFSKLLTGSASSFGKSINMEYGAELSPGGENSKGTVTVDTLSMNYGAIVDFDIFSSDLTADQVTVNKKLIFGALTLGNGPKYYNPVFHFTRHNATGATSPAAGRYLIMEAPAVEGDLSSVILEGLSGIKCSLLNEDGKIYLVISDQRQAANIVWTGSQSTLWDLGTTENFADEDGNSYTFVTGDKVTFNDYAVNTTVNIASEVSPASVTVTSDTKNFTIGGDGFISGAGKLVKTGKGTLTMNGLNTYTGGNTVSGGVLQVSTLPNPTQEKSSIGTYTAGATAITLADSAILAPTADSQLGMNVVITDKGCFGGSKSTIVNGSITGNILIKTGSGTLTTGGANTLKKTYVYGGTLAVGEINSNYDQLGDTVVINGGTLRTPDSSGSYSTAPWNILVPAGSTSSLTGDSRCAYTGKLFGEGKLNVYAPSASGKCPRCAFKGDWSNFSGTIVPTTDGSDFQFANSYGLPKAKVVLGSDVNFTGMLAENGTTYPCAIGEVTGTGSLGSSKGWTIGDEGNFKFDGTISSSALIKAGTGTMTLSGVSTPVSVTVTAGTLCLNNTSVTSGMIGTGSLIVKKGACLRGSTKLTNFPVQIYGTVSPGITETSMQGTLDFGGKTVTVNAGATLSFYITGGTLYQKLTNIGTLNMLSTDTVRVKFKTYTPKEGDTFQLWNATTSNVSVSNLQLDLQSLGSQFTWDTSNISTGVIKVTISAGMQEILDGAVLNCTAIADNGAVVAHFKSAQQNIQTVLNDLQIPSGIYLVKGQHGDVTVVNKYTK